MGAVIISVTQCSNMYRVLESQIHTSNMDPFVRELIKTIMALPFLPHNQMVAEFEMKHAKVLQSNMAEPVKSFIKYVANTCFESSIWAPRDISVFNRLVRTNNDLEDTIRG